MNWRQLLSLLAVMMAGAGSLSARAAEPVDYRFAPGDVIEVTVTPQHTFDRTVTVQPDGKISYPLVGQLQAAGLSVQQLSEKLREGLNKDLVDPSVTVSLKELSQRAFGRVSVLGAVRNPGGFDIKIGTTVAEALAAAGGAAPLADLHRVTITRTDHSVVTVDLGQTENSGRLERNVTLQPGDIIVVPEGAQPAVLVLGEVTKPASYPIPREARLMDAISLAGGWTPKADLRRVTLAHAGAGGTRTLDLEPLLINGDTTNPDLNVLLQPGDTLFVPETVQQVYVVGSVGKPGPYPIRPNDRVLDVLVKAGGAVGGASKAVLVRRSDKGEPTPRQLDLNKIQGKGDLAENQVVQPGDVLFVPDKKNPHSLSDTASLFYPLTYFLGLFR